MARSGAHASAFTIKLEHAFCRSGFELLEAFARAIQILPGHSAVRALDQQNKLDCCPGAAGGFCENQRDAGILHGVPHVRPSR